MLSDHFEKIILSKIDKTPTNGQKQLIKQLASFVLTSGPDEIFLITGYAGTGKTTAISAIINALYDLKIKSTLMAPTGRAAKVLSNFSGKPAHTIHKNIYKQKSSNDGFGKFVLGKNLSADTFFIVDEASMIGNQSFDASIFGSGNLLDDLVSYVYTGTRCKLILIGDSAQLPPVNSPESPALNVSNLKSLGFSVQHVCLTDVVRQSLASGILNNATKVRNLIAENKIEIPTFITSQFTDINFRA
jgi:exodeoxyribonuclease-5